MKEAELQQKAIGLMNQFKPFIKEDSNVSWMWYARHCAIIVCHTIIHENAVKGKKYEEQPEIVHHWNSLKNAIENF